MSNQLITAEEARRAVDFLIDSAAEYAAAVADREKAEHMLKVTKALVMKQGDGPVSAQERDAVASAPYGEALATLFDAVRDMEKLKALRQAASTKIEFWRSYEATHRQAERGFHSARQI